jgi:hypothetical protein
MPRSSWRGASAIRRRLVDPNDAFVGDRLVAYAHALPGRPGRRAAPRIERMLAGYRPLERQRTPSAFQFDQRIIGRMTLAMVQWVQGEAERRDRLCRGERARRAVHRPSVDAVQRADQVLLPVALLVRPHRSRPALRRTAAAAHERAPAVHVASGRPAASRAWCSWPEVSLTGAAGGAQCPRRPAEARFAFPQTWVCSVLALADAHAGAIDQALTTIEQAIEQARVTTSAGAFPELLRVRGEVLRRRADAASRAAARLAFEQALAAAHESGTSGWARRAQASLQSLALTASSVASSTAPGAVHCSVEQLHDLCTRAHRSARDPS